MTGYITWVNRVFVSNSYAEALRDGNNVIVRFHYYNVKTDKESGAIIMSLDKAVRLGERRREDGRYKNFEFYID